MIGRRALAVASVAVALAVAGCSSASDKPTPATTMVTASSVKVTGDLSYAVWKRVVNGFMPPGVPDSSPLHAVTSVSDWSTSGTIQVKTDNRLSKAAATTIGEGVMRLGAYDDTSLTTVIVTDAAGLDTNVFRHDVPGVKH